MEKTRVPTAADLESQFLEQAMLEARPVLEPWFGEDQLRENLAKEIARDMAATREDGVCMMELPKGQWAAVYVQPGELTEPMPEAHIRHRSFAIDDEGVLAELASEVRSALEPYPPKRVLAYTYGDQPLLDMRPDMHVVAGLIENLQLPPDAKCPPQLRLEEPSSLDFYDEYREWYEEFWRRRPHLENQIDIESQEDIAECLEAGGVRLVYHDGERCGLLAAQPRFEFGLCGWRIRERVTAPERWGRDISTAALIAFTRSLKAIGEREAIWGTIIPANRSSLNSALRIGRRITATLWEIA